MNIYYYDLYYIVIINRDGKEIVDDKYENNCISFNSFLTPTHEMEEKMLMNF